MSMLCQLPKRSNKGHTFFGKSHNKQQRWGGKNRQRGRIHPEWSCERNVPLYSKHWGFAHKKEKFWTFIVITFNVFPEKTGYIKDNFGIFGSLGIPINNREGGNGIREKSRKRQRKVVEFGGYFDRKEGKRRKNKGISKHDFNVHLL